LQGKLILIVDDHPAVRGILRSHFESEGLEVCDAADGAHAVNKAQGSGHIMPDEQTEGSNCRFLVKQVVDGRPFLTVQLYHDTIPLLNTANHRI
jgi:CheY-like chemotaxis protein